MVVGVADALGALKTAGELVKSLIDIRDVSLVQIKAFELGREIIAAQQGALASQEAQAALARRVGELEKEIVRFETWEAEKQRYELHEIEPGRFTYRLKAAMAGSEPAHEICAHCYQRAVKSILQARIERAGRMHLLTCHNCQSEINLTLA